MNKTESYCYQKYKSSSNNSCVIKEKNIVGKNLLEGTYFDGNGIPKMIAIPKAEYLEYKQLKDNWNKLKEHYKRKVEETKNSTALYDKWTRYSSVLSKMNELERSDSEC